MTIHFSNTGDASELTAGAHDVVSDDPRAGVYRTYFKRLLDIAFVILGAPVWLPVVVILAVVLRVSGSRPFYFQDRVGMGGKIFRIWKMRTMVENAEQALERHIAENPKARREWDVTQKLKHDPRITPLGRFLRKTSLDELPQLVNVLKGDMSLVGPRPMMPSQRALYPGSAYYALRPGITGFWQVSKRNETSFEGRAAFDADYDRELSAGTDFKVLLRTIAVVLKGTGH